MEKQMKVHNVKTWSFYYVMAEKGIKPFEIRKNDSNYEIGDVFVSNEYDEYSGRYTGKTMRGSICNVSTFKQQDGYVVLGIIWENTNEKTD